jgi:sugar-specific transcriptional regulator TrmB
MKDLDKRLEIIYKEIEKNLSLQGELQDRVEKLKSDNQELTNRMKVLDEQLKKAREAGEMAQLEKLKHNSQHNQEINNKIDELLSEVERCITLLKN